MKNQSDLPSSVIDGLESSLQVERSQNQAEVKRLQGDHVHYGQIVQLLCCSSEAFITVRKNVAKIEGQCLKVEMSENGDEGSWFQVEPAFKFRTVGNRIAYGDSVRLVSVKFKQYLHISSSPLPIQTPYFEGVYEVNASTTPATFEVMPFASVSDVDEKKVVCGRVLCIKHSEMNGFLMFDPALPARGPFWSVEEEGEATQEWKVSNALWSIEAQTVEWGGGPLQATLGTSGTDRTKQKGYRLEHVNTGLYLTLASAPKEGTAAAGPRLTMTELFTSDKTLWYFRFKNEGGDSDEGQPSQLDYSSVTPVYLQHSSGVWLSRTAAEGDDAITALTLSAGGSAGPGLGPNSEAGVWKGGAQLACRKELNFTDSVAVLDINQGAMREIARLLKLMKPVEFFLAEARARAAGFDVPNTDTPELQAALESVDRAERERGGLGPLQFMSNLNPMQAVQGISSINPMQTISSLNPLRGFEDENPNKVSETVAATVALLRKNVGAGVPGAKRQLARFFGSVLRSRIQTMLARRKADCGHLRSKRSELVECLHQIRGWLARDPSAAPPRWHQNTLREQGALAVLDSLLRALVDAGFVLVDSAAHSGSLRETSALLASVYFTEIGALLFDILRLACAGNPANAAALRGSVPVYDLYLGTAFDAAGLLHEIFKNREITSAFRENDVLRYAVLMSQHRRPVFVRLIRNLLASDGRPVPTNQRLVAGLLFSRLQSSLPEMRVAPPEGAREHSRILLRRHADHGGPSKTPGSGSPDRQSAPSAQGRDWIELEGFVESFARTCSKHTAAMTEDELVVVYFSEVLELLRDLCRRRCAEAIELVSKNGSMQLDYGSVLETMRSRLVPFEIRGRMCELMTALYVDCEPQRLRTLIPEVRLLVPSSAHTESFAPSQSAARGSIQFERLELLKAAVLDHIEAFAADPLESNQGPKTALLKHICEVGIMLLGFGLFLSQKGLTLVAEDLDRLIDAILKNVNGTNLFRAAQQRSITSEGDDAAVASLNDTPGEDVNKGDKLNGGGSIDEHVSASEAENEVLLLKSEVLWLMGRMLELAFDIRSGCRIESLVCMFERHDLAAGRNGDIVESEMAVLLGEMKNQICNSNVGKCSGEQITESIFRLSKVQENPRLQALALKLLLRQLAPIRETIEISQTLLLVDDAVSVSCCNQLRESVGLIRNCVEDSLGSMQLDTISLLSDNLRIISELLDCQKYGSYLVKEAQKFLLLDKFHLVVRDILNVPLGLKLSESGLHLAESSSMLHLFVRCYDVLEAFCQNSTTNQDELFLLVPGFLEHISIEGLNATDCITSCLRGNVALCSRIPERILRYFLMAIVKYGKRARWLRVLLVSMAGDGQRHIDHAQEIVLRNLEEMAELILELDGHQGDGALDAEARQGETEATNGLLQNEDAKKTGTPTKDEGRAGADRSKLNSNFNAMKNDQSAANAQREESVPSVPARQIKRKETSRLLAREGTATRQQLMMQREHEKQDSFLQYHITCLETLAKCAEGLNQTRKSKCQVFLSFDEVVESILDLHLSARPDAVQKVSHDVLRYIRTGAGHSFLSCLYSL